MKRVFVASDVLDALPIVLLLVLTAWGNAIGMLAVSAIALFVLFVTGALLARRRQG